MTHLHFFFHGRFAGPNATAVLVAVPPGTNATFNTFGAVIVLDDPLRDGPEASSKLIGKAQGLTAQASQEGTYLLMVVNFVFKAGKYNGSSLAILGRFVPDVSGTERSIVGGSKLIGRAQGLSAQASLDGTALLTAINFVFTEGEYNGSTVVILGKTVSSALTIEHTIVGGSGRFRMARGYTVSKVISWGGGCFLMEFDAYIIHH
ncbi:disease resistance response protein 206 [Musa troglodytarum]|uniref:Dirigent protein n=1 Tax=Musa troglodytarum TaxID=320322 RepID=A0A9E7HKF9_9LILI|nr:disease resistance response protein 206 [Musa troglodytarum]